MDSSRDKSSDEEGDQSEGREKAEEEEEAEEWGQHTVRIRFTIKNNSNSNSNSNRNNQQLSSGAEHSPDCLQSRNRIGHDGLEAERVQQSETCDSNGGNNSKEDRRLFKFIQPHNHKSSLFVNLSDKDDHNKHLFVSPDLDEQPSPPTSPANSSACSSTSQATDCAFDRKLSYLDMSQSCGFINSYLLSRRRSSSATPTAASTPDSGPAGRRAASSQDLADEPRPLANKSSSGNHLMVEDSSVQTIRATGVLQRPHEAAQSQADQPLEVFVEGPPQYSSSAYHPISLDDILQIDSDKSRLEEECRNLEEQVRVWEERVDEMERRRFADDVPRTLVENVLNQRRKLRDIQCQIYKLDLDLESPSADDDDQHPHDRVMMKFASPTSEENFHLNYCTHSKADNVLDLVDPSCILATGRFGSHIVPGQENTADILDAIPPSGSLQHKHYLGKASTGTDSSEYSQLPSFGRHHNRHHHHRLSSARPVSSDRGSLHTDDSSCGGGGQLHHHQLQPELAFSQEKRHPIYENQRQVFVQCTDQRRQAPVRPDHFKDDFDIIMSQGSSSTTSSGSPQNM